MQNILELQTGQVSFLSGILAGFAMTAALNIMRYGIHTRTAQMAFWAASLASLLFIVALYIDVRLTLELTGKENISVSVQEQIASLRLIGTSSATAALFLFVVAISMLGCITPKRNTGVVTAIMGFCILFLLMYVWFQVGGISTELNGG